MRGPRRAVLSMVAALAAGVSFAAGAPAAADAPGEGMALFTQNCALCHQADAAGLPGQFPRLRGRVGPMSAKAQGRQYLIDVVSFGMAGLVTVDNQSIVGVMPPLQLSDAGAAQVLNYLAGLAYAQPREFTAAEVAAERALGPKTGSDVNALRRALHDAKRLDPKLLE